MTIRPPFRQKILPGQSGRDVKAVKLAYRRLGVAGAGSMALTKRAGPAFVRVTKTFQRNHHHAVTGVYDEGTHDRLVAAKPWTTWMRYLYRTAVIRAEEPTPAPTLDAQAAAKWLLASGKWHADNPGDMRDMEATAAGHAVWSQGGYWVHIDHRVLDILVWVIKQGHTLGTYALCSDHHNDGPHGHAGGLAVDISTIDGVGIASSRAKAKTLALAKLLNSAPTALKPRQQICGGYGYMRDSEISACTIPDAAYYGYQTMQDHTNHVHVGY